MSKGLKIFFVLGGIIVALGVIAVSIYYLIMLTVFNKTSPIDTPPLPAPTSSIVITITPHIVETIDTVAPTESVAITPPSGWIAIDNTSQSYIAYRPSGWYFRLFPPAMELLGIDVNQIPDASEWGGIITMARLNASNNFESYKSGLEAGYTTSVQSIGGRSWTIIEGITPANMLFDSQFVKYAYTDVGGKEFLASIRSSAANYGGQEGNFDIFVQTIRFY
jgi:hypothetical protein